MHAQTKRDGQRDDYGQTGPRICCRPRRSSNHLTNHRRCGDFQTHRPLGPACPESGGIRSINWNSYRHCCRAASGNSSNVITIQQETLEARRNLRNTHLSAPCVDSAGAFVPLFFKRGLTPRQHNHPGAHPGQTCDCNINWNLRHACKATIS